MFKGTCGVRAQGRTERKRHLKGERLTYKEAVYAKCYDCTGDYADGKYSCGITDCSLYPFMPYRKDEK